MMSSEVLGVLKGASDEAIAIAISRSFSEADEAIALSKWKAAGVAVGHYVEAVRRLIEFRLFGSYTPIDKSLPPLNHKTLAAYEAGSGPDCLRFHIPRVLFAIYGMRNKKGYGHLSLHLADRIDATFMVDASRWILTELLREYMPNSDNAEALVKSVADRRLPELWAVGATKRVLRSEVTLQKAVLVLLYEGREVSFSGLMTATEARKDYLSRTLKKLHALRWIEFSQADGMVTLSPTGSLEAEKLLLEMR